MQGEGNANKEIVNLLLNLLGRDDYRRKFIDTFCIIGGSVFEPTRAGKIVDELLANVQAMCQLMRNQGISDGHDPDRAAQDIKNKLSGRSQKMANCLKNFSYAKLTTTAQAVKLKTDTEGATLFINGIAVPYADFNGHLFAPVTLKAEAPAGYRFAGWKKGSEIISTNKEMSLPTGSLTLTATFVADDSHPVAPVRINEVSADNGIYVNEYFKRNDWVELYNTTAKPVDVEGMYISDDVDDPTQYKITKDGTGTNTIIPAHGYLVIWCDKLTPQSQLHASFKLSNKDGDVLLTAADESWNDRFTYTKMKNDETAGRYPDGGNQVFTMNIPTIERSNITSSYVIPVKQAEVDGISDIAAETTFGVCYASDRLVVSASADGNVRVCIASLSGRQVAAMGAMLTSGRSEIPVGNLSAGAYVAVVTDTHGHRAVCKFIKD